jgi:hypothetical protein
MSLLDTLPLFATDSELGAAVLGKKRAGEWRQIAAHFEGKGLPPIDHLCGGRYVPAVKKFFDELWNVNAPGTLPARDGTDKPEKWNLREKHRT